MFRTLCGSQAFVAIFGLAMLLIAVHVSRLASDLGAPSLACLFVFVVVGAIGAIPALVGLSPKP